MCGAGSTLVAACTPPAIVPPPQRPPGRRARRSAPALPPDTPPFPHNRPADRFAERGRRSASCSAAGRRGGSWSSVLCQQLVNVHRRGWRQDGGKLVHGGPLVATTAVIESD